MPDNIVIITTTKPNSVVSHKRVENMINTFSNYNIPIIINDYVNKKKSISEISCEFIINSLQILKKYDSEYSIICENDFNPISNFLNELNFTVKMLPSTWRTLHFCPGYLWGRIYRDKTKIGKLNPEGFISNLQYDSSGRVFINCNANDYRNIRCWLGGPVAFLVNNKYIDSLLHDFKNYYDVNKEPNDVILTNILTPNIDFICRDPILGYENEQGGTTF